MLLLLPLYRISLQAEIAVRLPLRNVIAYISRFQMMLQDRIVLPSG
jgi:hypothetical protein